MKKIILIILIMTNLGCAKKKNSNVEPSWADRMQATAKNFQELLPYIYNKDKFSSQKNKKKIATKIKKFRNTIHQIKADKAIQIMGDDPHILQSLKNLKELTSRASDSFKQGDHKTSRILLKATTNSCFKCHTRQNLGPESLQWHDFDVASMKTSTIEKTQLLVSMRQYDKAKKQLATDLTNQEYDNAFSMRYQAALRNYVIISLRAQNQSNHTLKFLREKSLVTGMPTQLHYTIKHWIKDLNYWVKNKNKFKMTLKTAKNILKKRKHNNRDRNLINNLIASQILHKSLSLQQANRDKAKTYHLLGTIYDQLISEGYWDLPENYYESCIRYSPKTDIARACFQRFKTNITLGYSGSRGTFIPASEYERLEELRKISGLN